MKKAKKILIILIVLTLAVIWIHSAMSPEASSDESNWVTRLLEPFLELFVGKGNVTEHLVRKLAHFCEFALLGAELFLLSAFMAEEKGLLPVRRANMAGTCNLVLIAAVIDETIQIFSLRGSSLKDVWLDFAGGTCGMLFFAAIMAIGKVNSRRADHAPERKENEI